MLGQCFLCLSLFAIYASGEGLFDITSIGTTIENVLVENEVPAFTNDIYLPPPELIKKEGYPAETHVVQTEDGYLLTMHRIPGSPSYPSKKYKATVFVGHGVWSSSADWITTGKEKGLGYLLADRGYDVWLANFRGNTYSRNHTTLSPSDVKFWDFSVHEMGIYDAPAMIDYITNYTKVNSVQYVCHSLGAGVITVMASERPDLIVKVRAIFSMGPGVFLSHMKSYLRLLAPFWEAVQGYIEPRSRLASDPVITDLVNVQRLAINILNHGELLPHDAFTQFVITNFCDASKLEEMICVDAVLSASGIDNEQFNYTLFPVISAHYPAGSSGKTLAHALQGVLTGKFRKYDYGPMENLKRYGSLLPPDYNISRSNVPEALFYGENDLLVVEEDVMILYEKLPVKLGNYKVNRTKFTHMDFLYAIDAPDLVYKKIFSLMEEHLD